MLSNGRGRIEEWNFQVNDDKAHEVDGYNSVFYKHCWDIMDIDIVKAI